MAEKRQTPAELRGVFGANLRQMAQGYVSISELARQLGINRTQFNRYLSGESFPRPDILARICAFFEVDARVLLEPVEQIRDRNDGLTGPFLRDYIGQEASFLSEEVFPSGFYQFSRRSFLDPSMFVRGVVHVHRQGRSTYIRGFEPPAAMGAQGVAPKRSAREFRGLLIRQEDGVAGLIAQKGSRTASFNFLSPVSSFEQNYWVGYVTRTIREAPDGERATRMVYELLKRELKIIKAAVRNSGYCALNDLLPYHQRLLLAGEPFR